MCEDGARAEGASGGLGATRETNLARGVAPVAKRRGKGGELDGIFVVYFCNSALSSSRTSNPLKKWFFPPTGAFAATPSLITPNLAEGKIPRGLRWPPPATAVFAAPTLPRGLEVVVVFPVAIATPAPTANAIAMNVFFLDQ